MKKILFAFLFGVILFACQSDQARTKAENQKPQKEEKLGEINFEVTGSAEAQPYFKKGLLLLHSFEFDDAQVEFAKAREIDPDMAMAYWGEAMTHNHPLWSYVNLEEGRAVLNALGETPQARQEKAKTQIEKDFLASLDALYGEGEKLERDDAYAARLAEMHKTYSDHHEVAAFYALALLGSVDEGRDEEVYEKGAAIAQKILDKNPEHPGALHYLIHSYDDPDHAHQAVFAADNYSKVAPDAGHALHMPSHIYIALGNWDDVISSNIASFEASVTRMKKKELTNDALGYHALHWLMYGHLQKGENDEALSIINDMKEYSEGLESPRSRSYRISMEANYRNDVNEWDPTIADLSCKSDDLNIAVHGADLFNQAMIAYHNDDLSTLNSLIDTLSMKRKKSQDKVMQRGAKMCSNVSWYKQLPTQVEVNQAHIMELELMAFQAMSKNDDAKVEALLKQATELEDETSFSFGPPTVAKPSHELYADWLLKQGRHADARVQYEKALERAPGRKLSVEGLAESKKQVL